MLDVVDLSAWHGAAEVVRRVSLTVPAGRVVAVIGANGAGKTTLVRAIVGLHLARRGKVQIDGRDIGDADAITAARAGTAIVPQGRHIFNSLTVREHFTIAERSMRTSVMSRDELFELFPRMYERLDVRARALSGGEQQMLAIARAVVHGPSVLVLDEPTEGLAPSVVERVGTLIARLTGRGVAVLLTEQQRGFPHEVADEILHMNRGEISAAESKDTTKPPAEAAGENKETVQ